MNLLQKITGWLGKQNTSQAIPPQVEELKGLLEQAERYHHSGLYDEALLTIEQAKAVALTIGDTERLMILELSRAGVFAKQGHAEEARKLLNQLRADAESQQNNGRLAYVLISLGVLAQERGAWEEAEQHYETALRKARIAKSTGAEGRAQAHLADVALHDNNASFASYLLKEALPKLNMSGDIQLNSYFVGRLGEALIELGQVNEGQQLLGRALRLSEHMGYREYEIQWRKALALQAMSNDNYADARRHFMSVVANADKNASEYVISLSRLSKACLRLGDYDAALDYAQQAQDAAANFDDRADLQAISHAALGVVLRSMGRVDDARPHLDGAITDYQNLKLTSADHSFVDVLRNLAAAQTVMGDFDLAKQVYERALDYAQLTDAQLDIAGIYRDIGILYTHQRDLEGAIKVWSQSLQIYEMENEPARVARLYCDIANLRKQLGQRQRAIEDYRQALMLLSSFDDDETRGIVLSNAAAAYIDQGDIQTAESFFIEAIKLAQRLNDRHSEATRRGNYGWFLLSTGRADRAIASLNYALRQSQNLNMELQIAVQTDNIGLAQAELGRYEEALKQHQRALELISGASNRYWEAIIHANTGHTLLAIEKFDEAEPHFIQALAQGREEEDTEILVKSLCGLALILIARGRLDDAGEMVNEAVALADHAQTRRLLADALATRSEYYAALGENDLAVEGWKQARNLYEILHLPLERRKPTWISDPFTA